MDYRAVSGVFVALTIIFGGSTAYFAATPSHVTSTVTSTATSTSVATTTAMQTVTTTAMQTVTTTGTAGSPQTVTSTATMTQTYSAYSLNVAYNQSIGYYLTNSTGFTLYMFKADKPYNGTSACYGKCAALWPAFYSSSISAPPGVNASAFGTITRTDGAKQTTYEGWPLYHFHLDSAPGEMMGQGLFKLWYAFPLPASGSNTTSTTMTATS